MGKPEEISINADAAAQNVRKLTDALGRAFGLGQGGSGQKALGSGGGSFAIPLPDSQTVGPDEIVWKWKCEGGIEVIVSYGRDGFYEIRLISADLTEDNIERDVALSLGKALIAAAGYKDNWKQFAGEFISDDFFGKPMPEVEVVEGEVEAGVEVGLGMQLAEEAAERGDITVRVVDADDTVNSLEKIEIDLGIAEGGPKGGGK